MVGAMFALFYTTDNDLKGRGVAAKHVEKRKNGRPGAAAAAPRPQTFRKALASGIPPCFGQTCTECLAFYRLSGDPAVAFVWDD